jgi:tetratricopeptide (TPR) repeat protein
LMSAADKVDRENAELNRKSSTVALDTGKKLQGDISRAIASVEILLERTTKMMNDAHKTARKAAEFAVSIEEFDKHLTSQTKHNKVILNLLIKDSSQAIVDADKAVIAASSAMIKSIDAVSKVIHLRHSLVKAQTLLGEIIPMLGSDQDRGKKKGLDDLLLEVYEEANAYYETSFTEKEEALEKYRKAMEEYSKCNTTSTIATASYNAALAALTQSAN